MFDRHESRVSDSRRREIVEKVQSVETANEYLDLVHNTIVWIHENYKGPQLGVKLYKIRGICTAIIQEIPSISGEWRDVYERARDYRAQSDGQLPTNYHGQVITNGAEVVVEEDEKSEYRLADNGDGSIVSERLEIGR